MVKILLLIAIIAVVVVVARAVRHPRRSTDDRAALRSAKAGKLAADTVHLGRQGGQGMNQGGFGGGFG